MTHYYDSDPETRVTAPRGDAEVAGTREGEPSTPLARGADGWVSEHTAAVMRAGVAAGTRRAYAADRMRFRAWCGRNGRSSLPASPETLAEYAAHLAESGKAPSTIERALAAVRTEHRAGGLTPPDATAARLVLRGYRKHRSARGLTNRSQAEALTVQQVRELVRACPDTLAGRRDRALILLGWALMARRSELVAINLADLTEVEEGLLVLIRTSKTDPEASGTEVAVPCGSHPDTCPVRAVRDYREALAEASHTWGALFVGVDRYGRPAHHPRAAGRAAADGGRLTGQGVGIILRRRARAAGVDPSSLRAHSLRAGGATGAYEAGADALTIARHGRWKDGSPVLLGYIRTRERWRTNPMTHVGL